MSRHNVCVMEMGISCDALSHEIPYGNPRVEPVLYPATVSLHANFAMTSFIGRILHLVDPEIQDGHIEVNRCLPLSSMSLDSKSEEDLANTVFH